MIKRRVQKETLVIELEVLLGLADAALAQGEELLALGERPYGHGPFFKGNRHVLVLGETKGLLGQTDPVRAPKCNQHQEAGIVREFHENPKSCCKSGDLT